MKSIVILISGRGSNMEAIVQRCAAEAWPARVAAVISNRADAAGLQFAQSHGIETAVARSCAAAKRSPAASARLLITAATRAGQPSAAQRCTMASMLEPRPEIRMTIDFIEAV